jgi:hypothetical protein
MESAIQTLESSKTWGLTFPLYRHVMFYHQLPCISDFVNVFCPLTHEGPSLAPLHDGRKSHLTAFSRLLGFSQFTGLSRIFSK